MFDENGLLLVLAALVLEPDAYDARTEAGHLDQLLLHERIGPWVGAVARAQRVQLLLVEHGAHACRLVLAVMVMVMVVMVVAVGVGVCCRIGVLLLLDGLGGLWRRCC